MADRLSQYEEVFQQAYTHGLEAIYTLQTVDVASIRRVSAAPIAESKKHTHTSIEPQLTFDFGPAFRDWIQPLWMMEPIRVLGLSTNAQRGLLALRKSRLQDLIGLDVRQLIFSKALGQGHIDEIQQKLAQYLADQPSARAYRLDVACWIRGICGELESKSAYLLCEKFGLQSCLSISVGELGELKRALPEQRLRWIEDATNQLQQQPPTEQWRHMIWAFFGSWLRQRGGVANKSQLVERLQQVSLQPELVPSLLQFLSVVTQSSCPFSIGLCVAEEDVFCDSIQTLKRYRLVLNLCRSYFLTSCQLYNHNHLIALVSKETAKHWEEIDEFFIERCLRLSRHFFVRKLPNIGLVVRVR